MAHSSAGREAENLPDRGIGSSRLLRRQPLAHPAAVLAPVLFPWDGHVGRNGEGVFLCLVLTGMALALHDEAHDQPDAPAA